MCKGKVRNGFVGHPDAQRRTPSDHLHAVWARALCADAKAQAAIHPFEHKVLVRPTGFSPRRPAHEDVRIQFHDLYDELMADEARNQLICGDVVQADVQAYRRDRCKDRLLQEHGYFVLRFLAVDVGKCLDEILDTILRVLVTQEKESS